MEGSVPQGGGIGVADDIDREGYALSTHTRSDCHQILTERASERHHRNGMADGSLRGQHWSGATIGLPVDLSPGWPLRR
jgi:hypothetical protein